MDAAPTAGDAGQPAPPPAIPPVASGAGRRVWICGHGEFTLPEAKRKLGLPFEIIRRRLDNGGGQCKDYEIYWSDQRLRASVP